MEGKTPIYIMIIVGIVALVAVVSMLTRPSVNTNVGTTNGNLMTGNVVSEDVSDVSFLGFTRFLVGVTLIGSCIYMYRHAK
jgi:uncharacterized membrane protein